MNRSLWPSCVIAVGLLSGEACVAQDHDMFGHDPTTYSMPAARSSVSVPFTFELNQVRLDASVNGAKPLRIVLDTGMPTPGLLLFRSKAVDALELTDTGAGPEIGGGGSEGESVSARMAIATRLDIGELALGQVPVMLVRRPPGFPEDIEGIIGGALFYRYVVRVDFDRGQVELIEPKSYVPPEGASIVLMSREPMAAFVTARVTVDDRAPVETDLVLDLGAGHAVSLNAPAKRNDGVAPPTRSIETKVGRGLMGPMFGKVGRVKKFEIGGFAFDDVVATFPVAEHQRPGGADHRGGNLGAGILKRFIVTFDYPSSRLVLAKGARFADPFENDMTGMVLDDAHGGERKIESVLADSPAAAAGIVAGDVLVQVGGTRMADWKLDELRKVFTTVESELTLSVRRGAEVREVRIKLRRLV